jgi:hypothetical protein
LDSVIGRRGIIIQLPPSSLAKLIILKPMVCNIGVDLQKTNPITDLDG